MIKHHIGYYNIKRILFIWNVLDIYDLIIYSGNGLNLIDPKLTLQSLAYSYAEVDPALVMTAAELALQDATVKGNVNIGTITSENGMGPTLSSKRDIIFDTAVVAAVDQFDSVWDAGIADYLSSGGQAISDERASKWVEIYGDADMLP